MEQKGTAYIAPGAVVVGDVVLEADVNIWYNAVLRGDSGLCLRLRTASRGLRG